ncbi:glycosyltransferase [Pontibacter pamirensis]|uniref:glycosyltransferase n=1 Tax=Pontibacter pamirensis TaxID=2562824 RepID=UPI0013898C10|nr:glycosyltransferase [Pontibacter pamirensis]
MNILIVMDPGILVPPKGYGGHERLVYMFAKEYRRLGHNVHLLVTTGSEVEGCVVHDFGKEGFPPKKWNARKAIPVAWKFLWKHRDQFDLIHNFGRLVYLIPILNHPVKKIMTYGREISRRNVSIINKLPNRNLIFTGCSNNLVSRGNIAGKWQAVYNAIEFDNYILNESVPQDAPLIFLGRLERVKGCHTAIKVAKATGNKLIIAGNVSPLPEEQEYFKNEIEPHIDNEKVIYVGQVNDEQKNHYLGKAKAFIFPLEWNEPFGMVMTEAMACGTPVIGYRRGSVPEVVEDGITGYVVNDEKEMIEALPKTKQIDRKLCRITAKNKFDVSVVAKNYLSLFS